MRTMIAQPETVAALNEVLRAIVEKSGIKVVGPSGFTQWNENCADYIFGCTPTVFADTRVSGAEVAHNADGDPKRKKLQALVKCRIENSLQNMIDLLQNEYDKLRSV